MGSQRSVGGGVCFREIARRPIMSWMEMPRTNRAPTTAKIHLALASRVSWPLAGCGGALAGTVAMARGGATTGNRLGCPGRRRRINAPQSNARPERPSIHLTLALVPSPSPLPSGVWREPSGRLGSMAIPESEFKPGVMLRQQRRGLKSGEEKRQPQAADANGGREIQPTDRQAALVEGRHHLPVDFDDVNHK